MREQDLRAAQEAFKEAVRGRPCASCGSRLFVQAHHVVYRQVIRAIAESSGRDPDVLEWDARDAMPLCPTCHQRHHSGAGRIARPLIVSTSPLALQFAAELGPQAVAHIKRAYPMPADHKETEQ